MANEPTIESMNRDIFDFLELKHSEHKDIDDWEMVTLHYHDDWNQLMRVVEKINHTVIPDNKHPASVIIFKTTCHINDDMNILIETTVTKNGTLVECVFNAVYQFITWYNQQKQKDGQQEAEDI